MGLGQDAARVFLRNVKNRSPVAEGYYRCRLTRAATISPPMFPSAGPITAMGRSSANEFVGSTSPAARAEARYRALRLSKLFLGAEDICRQVTALLDRVAVMGTRGRGVNAWTASSPIVRTRILAFMLMVLLAAR
jgi:hypothetical protein